MQLPFVHNLEDVEQVIPTPLRVRASSDFTGRGVTIAIVDSGFYPHPDLTQPTNRVRYHVDARREPPHEGLRFRVPHATSWHGTMVAGVCAGNGFMSFYRYTSLAPDAQMVLVKTGRVGTHHITEADIARALRWVLDNASRFDIRVVNVSVGGDVPSTGKMTALDRLVEALVEAGLVVVCAIGNSAAHKVIPPASAPSAITVGGLDDRNTLDRSQWRMYRSNYGRGARGVPKPELIAPAAWIAAPMLPNTRTHREAQFLWRLERASDEELRQILQTREAHQRISVETMSKPIPEIRRAVRQRINDEKFIHPHYQHVDGTSFAAAIVSSVVAQMLEANPELTPAEVKQILMQTAEPLEGVPPERQGAGVIHAGAAVAQAQALRPTVPVPEPRKRRP
ncbi:MAG: S8 family serine peptidase [Thermoflexales bacterium]|nr:S8 family serine peptidase [Thermoflexales bacterium]